jgi:hypothetical protein
MQRLLLAEPGRGSRLRRKIGDGMDAARLRGEVAGMRRGEDPLEPKRHLCAKVEMSNNH